MVAAYESIVDNVNACQVSAGDDLTNVRCQCCQSEFEHNSYDAGFIAGSGMCQACDAALPAKDIVIAGGVDERAAFELEIGEHSEGADLSRKHDGSYSNYYLECVWQGWQARAALTASAPNTAQPEVAENTGSQAMANHQLQCQELAVGRGVEDAATSDEALTPDDIFAWATSDGEGGYDLRLYEDNESYRDEFISLNGDKYASWVFPLHRAAFTAGRAAVPDGWRIVEKPTCFVLMHGREVVASLAGPEAERNAAHIAAMLAAAPSAQQQGEKP